MSSRGSPPQKVGRTDETQGSQRRSPESQDPETRMRRIARELGQPSTSEEPSEQAAQTEAGQEEPAGQGVRSRNGSAGSLDSATSGVGHVSIEAGARGQAQACTSAEAQNVAGGSGGGRGRGQFPSGEDAGRPAREDLRRGPPPQDIVTRPENVALTHCQDPGKYRRVDLMANFIQLEPMQERHIYQYRAEFEPNVESRAQRRWFFHEGVRDIFVKKPGFDGMHDFFCAQKLKDKVTTVTIDYPNEPDKKVTLTLTNVSEVEWKSHEMMRVYNLHMKRFLHELGFFQITVAGSWVHPGLATSIADGRVLSMVRGYKTAINRYEGDNILVQLESVHKLMQKRNVLQIMVEIRSQRPANLMEALNAELIGKVVVTSYNNKTYRIEAIRTDRNPKSEFEKKSNPDIKCFVDYYKHTYALNVSDERQPLLQAVMNNKRSKNERTNDGTKADKEILLIPEFCNIAGLTEQQRNDNRLKMDLIKSSQTPPAERVKQMKHFMSIFHSNVNVRDALKEWGYSYGNEPVKLQAHVLPVTKVGFGEGPNAFTPVDARSADFNVNQLARVPELHKLVILTTNIDLGRKQDILRNLRKGFDKVKLRPRSIEQIDVREGDSPAHYINALRRMGDDATAIIVVMHNQNKEKYDAIKKIAAVDRGIITQCVTAKLMLDERKISGATVKIAIQVAAKIGGEPWWVDIPLKNAMVCGYDTYRDTAKRGVSYGAFLASMNDRLSRWYSKADSHEQMDQVSTQLTECMAEALRKYKEVNGRFPERVFIYRDGVSEGALALIYNTELKKLIETLETADASIKLTVIVVNKSIGARFYMAQANNFQNPPPGTVVDHKVTRPNRFDFYLISQSTRQGTISPTYYNIIYDQSGMRPEHHQAMAYKLSLLYYNWSGSVRVPAPCQYAHKLAILCGEHLHAQPNPILNDRLHFL